MTLLVVGTEVDVFAEISWKLVVGAWLRRVFDCSDVQLVS